MSRKPVSASFAAAAGFLPACAVALGLGEIATRSYLNQPLVAEIPVTSDVPGEIAGLRVTLASAETFAAYGLQRPAVLGELAFAVASGPRGGVIRMTSAQPLAEPFITVLLEVSWPQGRLLREYTVLLDPPSFAGGAGTNQGTGPAPAPAPRAQAAPPAPAPEAAKPAVPPPAPTAAPTVGPAPATSAGSGGTHTVARNETLWGIAERYRPGAGIDQNQMMLAIYRANPDAFAGNINRLNAGAVLRIPDRGAIDSIAAGEAGAEVRRQNAQWSDAAANGAARLELVPPTQAATAATPPPVPATAGSSESARLRAEVDESRRLVAVKDAELEALRSRVTQLEKQAAGEVAVEERPATPPADVAAEASPAAQASSRAVAPAAEPAAEPAAAATATAPERTPARPRPPRPADDSGDRGVLDTITELLTSVWLWAAAALVVLTALLLARRRSSEEGPEWQPVMRRREPEPESDVVGDRDDDDMIVIEEPARAPATAAVERRVMTRGADEEMPLERTISAESAVNLDQSDPLAEADFHMAYGLYDQAADLLGAAIARDPTRRDLQLKLLDVYFVWENRDGFLKEARQLRERIGNDADPDWKRVVIMGKQICPGDALFAGTAAPAVAEVDLAFGSDGGTMEQPAFAATGGLDFDLTGADDQQGDASAAAARPRSTGMTQEMPTIEAPGMSASTMETPTLESAALATLETPTLEASLGDRTHETPTLEAPMAGHTLESPTMETWSQDVASTARLEGMGEEEHGEQTSEIDLEDLGLDLTGLDEVARDMATGLQEALPDGGGELDLDLGGDLLAGADNDDSMTDVEGTLGSLTRAVGIGRQRLDDTAEQHGMESTRSTRSLSATADELEAINIDLGLSGPDAEQGDLTATGLRAISPRRPEDPTMTEVGTKLDLARAYVDMGDPDGARSILNEVLEEGDEDQRVEARKLLETLSG